MTYEIMKKLIDVARGLEKADIVFKNAVYFNAFTKTFEKGDIAVSSGYIAGIGKYSGIREEDMRGLYICPGLTDSHIHFESSMLTPSEYAKAVIPHGVMTVIADPHEVGNVAGNDGISFLMEYAGKTPLDIRFMLPSCVPASPLERSGQNLSWKDLKVLDKDKSVLGLGEMMDFPGLLLKDRDKLEKILNSQDKFIDGHAPMLSGNDLNAYILTGVMTDHECSTIKEMEEKLKKGMYILIREGTGARNAAKLLKGVNKNNIDRIMFCTDDCHISDILARGTIDNIVNMALSKGMSMEEALLMATFNPARAYGLKRKGAIAPGYEAEIVVFDSLERFSPRAVYRGSERIAQDLEFTGKSETGNPETADSVILHDWKEEDLKINLRSGIANVLSLRENDLTTDLIKAEFDKGEFVPDSTYSKLVLIERHKGLPLMGKAILKGYGVTNGAIATTVAHDAHNLLIAGDNDRDIFIAMQEIKKTGGGIVLVSGGKVKGELPLPLFGLLSDRSFREVNATLSTIEWIAHEEMGVNRNLNPFLQLSFLALPVIPDVKLTCDGLYSMLRNRIVPVDFGL